MVNVKPHSDMQPVVTTHRHIAEDTLSQQRVTKLIQTAWKAFELRVFTQIKANSFAVLTQILHLTSQCACLDQEHSISLVVSTAAEGGMAALAPPIDKLNDDHDLPASDVVDFTPSMKSESSNLFSRLGPLSRPGASPS
jgi:hypothetical protein